MDGGVAADSRAGIAARFNHDVSLPLVLATTRVGGIGLNLSGADVVILVEHDWNPARDLQAMDRAHRIGQRRTVQVFRLIAKQSMEEEMMRLQLFKRRVAGAVVAEDDPEMQSRARGDAMVAALAPGRARTGAAALPASDGAEYDENNVESFVSKLEHDASAALAFANAP